jgi:hypothetical protein
MLALEVTVNGQRRYVAGHADSQLLKVIISGNRQFSFAGIGPFVAVPKGAASDLATLMYEDVRLSIGDEVVVRIVDVDRADPPAKRSTGEGSVRIGASDG